MLTNCSGLTTQARVAAYLGSRRHPSLHHALAEEAGGRTGHLAVRRGRPPRAAAQKSHHIYWASMYQTATIFLSPFPLLDGGGPKTVTNLLVFYAPKPPWFCHRLGAAHWAQSEACDTVDHAKCSSDGFPRNSPDLRRRALPVGVSGGLSYRGILQACGIGRQGEQAGSKWGTRGQHESCDR